VHLKGIVKPLQQLNYKGLCDVPGGTPRLNRRDRPLVGRRTRARIAVMVYSFVYVGVPVSVGIED
jgi:hypothetical protein